MSGKGSNTISSRNRNTNTNNTTPNEKRTERSSQRKSATDPKPLRRTPGVEEDDEIANYFQVEMPVAEAIARPRDPAVSVAGTEHQSIVEKMDWRQMKGLYDLVTKQKDEASRGTQMVIDASRFGGSDNLSDLSDNTSRDTTHPSVQDIHGRVGSLPLQAGSRRSLGLGGQPQQHHSAGLLDGVIGILGDTETECISNIDSLSVSALEGLVAYLSQKLNVKCRGESDTSHIEPSLPNPMASEECIFLRDRRSNSNLGTSPDSRQTPQRYTMQESPHLLSQSAPSSFFTGAVPLGLSAGNANNQNKRNSPRRISRENSSSVTGIPLKASRDDNEDEDEEIKSLSSNQNIEKQSTPGTEKHRRTLSTPSPKPRRHTTTPTKTPPIRSGAVPPVPFHGRDSAESESGGMNTMLCNTSMSMSAKSGTTNNRKRCSESPIVISGTPVISAAVLPVGIRKDSSSSISSVSVSIGDLRITLPENGHTNSHSKKQKPNYEYVNGRMVTEDRNSSRRYVSGAHLHLSPSCAFEDCSVNSGSSASYYSSSNYQ